MQKFLAIGFAIFELEALVHLIRKYSYIMEYLMVGDDDIVIRILHTLAIFGIVRFLILIFGFYMANRNLNQLILSKYLNPVLFGSGLIFVADWSIIQLYLFTIYLYEYRMPIVFFTSYILSIYYKYIRTEMEDYY